MVAVSETKSLAVTHPEIAAQWNHIRNGNLKPEDVTADSKRKVWWIFPYTNPYTGKHFDFEWEATVASRIKNPECPYLSGHSVWKGFNDLLAIIPELAEQWNHEKNGDLKPEDVVVNSNKKVWWLLPYTDPQTGKHFDFEWMASVASRAKGAGCPYLSSETV